MDNCIIDLEKLGIENRTNNVFYACSEFIIYKDKGTLYWDDCSGETLSSIPCHFDTQIIEHCDSGGDLVLVASGRELIIKTDEGLVRKSLPIHKTGRCVTALTSSKPDHIIFGSVLRGQIQFVNYNYRELSRSAQTASWAMSDISDFNWTDSSFYAVFDHSYIIACKSDTCEVEWQRLETGHVNGNIAPYGDNRVYTCDKNLKITDQSPRAETIKIPLVKVHHIECVIGDLLYFTSQEGKNLCCYNLSKREMVWEIPGKYTIHETLLVKGRDSADIYDVMILRLDDHIAIVNLSRGKSLYYIKVHKINHIRQTGDHILLHKAGGFTSLLPGSSV